MKLDAGQVSLSPTDLAQFLGCRHRTALELAAAHGVRARPVWDDPHLDRLFTLGLEHEREYVDRVKAEGRHVVEFPEDMPAADRIARTLEAMRAGDEIIVQAALANGRWYGKPDVLMKVGRPSPELGAWSYEPADTKLAAETRGGTILQLELYCELLEHAQGAAPERFHVVTPGRDGPDPIVRSYRFHDYSAYFRLVKAWFEAAIARGHEPLEAAHYPEPVDHCDVCPWIPGCRDRRRADDHLSLVAGLSRLHRRELEPRGITTMAQLGQLGHPIPFKPARGAAATYERVRDQARVQLQSRGEGRIVYELIPPAPAPAGVEGPDPVGLSRLPEPSPGDVFLDLEGDQLAAHGGREYLFGLVTVEADGDARYHRWWAENAGAERAAFDAVVDVITARLERHRDMHVYHYAPYEPSALKRLMGRHASREREIDQLLRGRRFVDLYAVVRQGLRAGVERYSIKNLEPIYAFTRGVVLSQANRALRTVEQALELDRLDAVTPDVRATVEGYNRDDCVSTLRLRDWLEARRAELVASGLVIDRPPLVPGEASEKLDEKAKDVGALRARLLAGVGEDPSARTPDEQARYQVAYLLDWHRREDKAGWWEYFRLRELPEQDLLDEPKAVAGLEFIGEVDQVKRSYVHRYAYPVQIVELRPGDKLSSPKDGEKFATVVGIDRQTRRLDILVGPRRRAERPTALFEHDHVGVDVIERAIFALGVRVADAGGVAPLPPGPDRALLLREPPRLIGVPFASPAAGAAVTDYAVEIGTRLEGTALAIQGPPGSGKTYTGARMIVQAVNAGLRVGVTATSHKVIRNLLDAVAREAARSGLEVRLGHKTGDDDDVEAAAGGSDVTQFSDNAAPLAALEPREIHVLGGTAWLWARPEYANAVDVLFVDEAGQMSLANVLGVARAGKNLVLLGDPQQLDQPSKGSHPEGIGGSALQYVLGDAHTMPEGRGLFLAVTWRLPPAICRFTSELFYENHLAAKPGLERQALAGPHSFTGAGLWLVTLDHEGNRNASDEEAAEVARIVQTLLAPGSLWVDERGIASAMTAGDLRVVAPFNAHVQRLRESLDRLPGGGDVPVGTVDKFQGQEAPVAIYSMATSHPDDAPRGMAFLYSLNRLNVATSRARCAAIVVASRRLFEPECRTPRQMTLANALCRFREMAVPVGAAPAPPAA